MHWVIDGYDLNNEFLTYIHVILNNYFVHMRNGRPEWFFSWVFHASLIEMKWIWKEIISVVNMQNYVVNVIKKVLNISMRIKRTVYV